MIKFENKSFYEKQGVYGQYDKRLMDRIEKSIKLIKLANPQIVLDAGCGDGFFAEKIQKTLQIEVIGIDNSNKAVYATSKRGINAKKVNLEKELPFNNEYFDLIHCGEVIEHLFNPDHMLKEFYRILKKNGALILSTPNLANWFNRLLLLVGYQPVFAEVSTVYKNLGRIGISKFFEKSNQPVGHIRVYTLSAIKELLKINGFIIEEVAGVNFHPEGFLSIFDKIFSYIPSLATIFILKAKKNDFIN